MRTLSRSALVIAALGLVGCATTDAPDGTDTDSDTTKALDPTCAERKWNPGHYYALSGETFNDTLWAGVLADLDATPALKGVMVRYAWVDLEGAEGGYDFSHIKQRLASLGDRRMMIFIQHKTFKPEIRAVPAYMRTAAYGGGDFPWANASGVVGGHAPRLMHPAVQARMKALMSALAAEFDDDPRVEAVIFAETALTQHPAWTGTNEADYWAGLRAVNAHRMGVFHQTISAQWVNYPRAQLATFIPDVRDNLGLALGGPDIVPQDTGLIYANPPNIGAYHHMTMSTGEVPIIYNASHPSYVSQTIDGTGEPQSIEQIYAYARDTLGATHLTWTRVPAYRAQVLAFLQTNAAPLNGRPARW